MGKANTISNLRKVGPVSWQCTFISPQYRSYLQQKSHASLGISVRNRSQRTLTCDKWLQNRHRPLPFSWVLIITKLLSSSWGNVTTQCLAVDLSFCLPLGAVEKGEYSRPNNRTPIPWYRAHTPVTIQAHPHIQRQYGNYEAKKVNLSLCLISLARRHEDIWGSGGIDPRILDLGNRWWWVVSFTPRTLYPRGKSPRYPSDLWVPELIWTTWKGEKSCPFRDSNSVPWAAQPVASHYTDWAIPDASMGTMANLNTSRVELCIKVILLFPGMWRRAVWLFIDAENVVSSGWMIMDMKWTESGTELSWRHVRHLLRGKTITVTNLSQNPWIFGTDLNPGLSR
jgi:hypothetical protein